MPRFDGTGPTGRGPMIGAGFAGVILMTGPLFPWGIDLPANIVDYFK